MGHGQRMVTFLPDGRIGEGAAGCEVYWDVRAVKDRVQLEVFSPERRTFTAWKKPRIGWVGRWECFEGMRVELRAGSGNVEAQ